jgi:hypothetical protein
MPQHIGQSRLFVRVLRRECVDAHFFRNAVVGVLFVCLSAPASGKDKPMGDCKVQLTVMRGDSPWQGYTSSAAEEQHGKHVRSAAITSAYELLARLAKYAPDGRALLAIDRAKKEVLVSAAHFSEIERRDATRISAGERLKLGTVTDKGLLGRPRELVLFLLDAQLIETYWHLEAQLCLVDEKDEQTRYRAHFTGVHRYCTNSCHNDSYAFAVEIDKTDGSMYLLGNVSR